MKKETRERILAVIAKMEDEASRGNMCEEAKAKLAELKALILREDESGGPRQ